MLAVLLAAIASAAHGGRPPGEHDLQLEVFVNGAATGLIAAFRRRGDGRLAVSPDEWRQLGLKAAPEAVAPDGLIDLDRVPGLSYRVDEAAQATRIVTSDDGRLPRIYDLRKTIAEPAFDTASVGGVLNYLLYASTGSHLDRFVRFAFGEHSAGANLDARLFGPLGVLSQTGILGARRDRHFSALRLDTTWTYSDPASLIAYRAGDLISGALAWARPVRIGGIQIQRDFSLRPDLVTLPMPRFSGSAAVPSTVDVYVNNLRTFSRDVPAGPFEIRNLPVVSGPGTQRIVVRDALGRETVTDQAFFATPKLLRAGLYDFSVEAGFPRLDYGLRSNGYAADPVASASLRRGLADSLTVELHAEGSARLLNGGAGLVVPVGSFGVASLALSGSSADGAAGMQIAAALEAAIGPAVLYVRTVRSFGEYTDIASITARAPAGPAAHQPFSFRPPRALDQVALSFPLGFDPARVSLNFTHVEDGFRARHHVLSASYSRPLGRELSLFATAFKDFGPHGGYGVYAGLTRAFGNGLSATASAAADSSGSSVGIDMVKAQPIGIGTHGWRLRDREGSLPNRAVAGSYRAPFGRFQAGVEQFGQSVRASGEIEGAVAVAGGDIFLANRIDDAFAVVDAGAPGVEVRYENRPAGKTDARGKLLLANLRAYQHNRVAIDPKSLPVDAEIPRTKTTVTPADRAGAVVRFGVAAAPSTALVSFRNDGAFIPSGSRGRLEATGANFVVGYDGEAFLRGLEPHNSVRIDLADGTACRAEFAFAPHPGTQVRIEGVPCI